MGEKNPVEYYNLECYGKRQCLHCGDCIAWSIRYLKMSQESEEKKKALIIKFLTSTICQENLPCPYALSLGELKSYIDKLTAGKVEAPISHYEFVRDL